MSLMGRWQSKVGSQLVLEQGSADPSELTGTFTREPPPGQVHGSYDNLANGNVALSFSVAWPSTPPGSGSVTSYTGQYHAGPLEYIHVVFLMASETSPEDDYQSVCVGEDLFNRLP